MSANNPPLRKPFFPYRPGFDWLGGGLSVLCLCHCLLLPPLLATYAVFAPLADETVHLGMTLTLLPLTLLAFLSGYQEHGHTRVLWLGALGCASLLAALFLEDVANGLAEKGLTVLGTGLLLSAHWINLQRRRRTGKHECCATEGRL